MPAQLKHGVKGASGGYRPNSGRKPEEFLRWIKDLVHSRKARKRFEKILNDEPDAEEKVTEQGVCVPVRARADTYLRALELAFHYGYGKPVDRVQHTTVDQNGDVAPVVVVLAAQSKGEAGGVES